MFQTQTSFAAADDAAILAARGSAGSHGGVLVETELRSRNSRAGAGLSSSLLGEPGSSRLSIQLAATERHHNEAIQLVSKMYGWRGYEFESKAARSNCATLIAFNDRRMVGTITVGFDSVAGLSVGELYPEQVVRLRAEGARLCEFTRLAVDRGEHSQELLAMMFHIAYMHARHVRGGTDLLIEVNPRHVGFYNRMLGFRIAGPERICPRVGAPAVLLRLPLDYGEREIATHGGTGIPESGRVRSLYPLFFSPSEEARIVRRLRPSAH